MSQLTFTSNFNGKLCHDIISDIRQANFAKFAIGNDIEIIYKNKSLGHAVVEAFKCIRLNELNDAMAYANCGHASFYQATLLKKFYGDITPDYPLMIVVMRYVTRNWDAQIELMRDNWNSKVERQNAPNRYLIREAI